MTTETVVTTHFGSGRNERLINIGGQF
jgi:hypothetical protein